MIVPVMVTVSDSGEPLKQFSVAPESVRIRAGVNELATFTLRIRPTAALRIGTEVEFLSGSFSASDGGKVPVTLEVNAGASATLRPKAVCDVTGTVLMPSKRDIFSGTIVIRSASGSRIELPVMLSTR